MARTKGAKDKKIRKLRKAIITANIIGGTGLLGTGLYLLARKRADNKAINKYADSVVDNMEENIKNIPRPKFDKKAYAKYMGYPKELYQNWNYTFLNDVSEFKRGKDKKKRKSKMMTRAGAWTRIIGTGLVGGGLSAGLARLFTGKSFDYNTGLVAALSGGTNVGVTTYLDHRKSKYSPIGKKKEDLE